MSIDYNVCLKRWGFNDDPFGEKYPYFEGFWAMPSRDIERLKFLLRSTSGRDSSLNILIRGEYGTGKTYHLEYLKSYVENELEGIGVYFQIQPRYQSKGFRDIYAEIIRNIEAERIIKIGKEIIKKENISSQPDFIEHVQKKIYNIDLSKIISNLVYDEDFALSWTWLKGDATIHQQRSLNLLENPKNETVAIQTLVNLVDYLLLSYPVFGIFIDELENLVGESRPIRSIREGIRNIYDRLIYDKKPRSVALVSSATAELAYQVRGFFGKPLLDRLDRDIEIPPLNEESARDFVEDLFKWARNSDDSSVTPPFIDENAYDEFINHAQITNILPGLGKTGFLTPRRIIKVGRYLLTESCFDDVEEINADYISKLLESE